MEAASVRGGSIPATSSSSSSSQPVRREWRAISEHAHRNNANEEVEHSKFGQTDERTIYEETVGSLNVDFCSVTSNGGNDVVIRKQLLDVCRRREELQQMEIQLRAQTIVQAEIMEVRNGYEAQLKEHSNATAKLKGQLQEREQHIRELELKVEEKDRELHAVNNEAAWAKEDFLREQNEKLATFRRERDNSEAEKAQHLKQIHDLQEHIKEKESFPRFGGAGEVFETCITKIILQHRVAQDAILYKDEQLREAQAWIARLQEVGALQSSSLQAELRERTDQFHQYYIAFQRQVMEMERHHVQTIQQLQLELVEARERNCVRANSSQLPSGSSMDSSLYDKSQGIENNPVDSVTLNGTSKFMPNGNLNGTASVVSLSSTSSEVERGMLVVSSSIVGVGELPSGRHVDHCFPSIQVKSLPSFIMHPQGVQQSVSSTDSFISPSELHQHWHDHQVLPDAAHTTVDNEHQTFKADQNSLESGVHYKHKLPVDKKEVHEDQLDTHLNPQLSGAKSNEPIADIQLVKSIEKNLYQMSREADESLSTNSQFCGTYGCDPPRLNNELEVVESDERSYQTSPVKHENLSANSKFHGTHGFDFPQQKIELKVDNETNPPSSVLQKGPAFNLSRQWSAATVAVSSTQNNSVIFRNIAKCNGNLITSEGSVSVPLASSPLAAGKSLEPTLLDERSLLACIVRAIPAGSGNGIRISSTLPNRLGKMLAPLHWHDYKKKYGKLDDFVILHPELFIIEGDFIHLREGAQEKISATTAAAKVAAAAASCAPYSSSLPSVAVTPVAQTHRLKKAQLSDSKPLITVQPTEGTDLPNRGDIGDINAQIPEVHGQQLNGFNFNPEQARTDLKILSKTSLTKDIHENHGSSESRPNHLPNPVTGNGVNLSRASLPPSQNKVSSNGRHTNGGRRHVGVGFVSRR